MLSSRQHQIMEAIAPCVKHYYLVKRNSTFYPQPESLVPSTDILLYVWSSVLISLLSSNITLDILFFSLADEAVLQKLGRANSLMPALIITNNKQQQQNNSFKQARKMCYNNFRGWPMYPLITQWLVKINSNGCCSVNIPPETINFYSHFFPLFRGFKSDC